MQTVLLAEDDRIQRELIVRALSKHADRFEVIAVDDGDEAIKAMKRTQVDLLITDICMPRINGLVLLAYTNTYHPNLPCFVISSYGTSRLRAKIPPDVLRFFHKPVKLADLVQSVVVALDRCKKKESPDKGISVVSFLKLIDMEQMTCRFEVTTAAGTNGFMLFENGVLWDAGYGELEGEAAALALIAAEMGTYRFGVTTEGAPRRIHTDLDQLVNTVFGNKSLDPEAPAHPGCSEETQTGC